jgi:DNA-binding transcriptional ArsR family regulator
MKEKIEELLKEGKTYKEISEDVGCTKSTISYHAKKLGLSRADGRGAPITYDWTEVQQHYNDSKSPTQTTNHFGMSKGSFSKALKRGSLDWVDPKIPLEELLVPSRDVTTSRQHLKGRLKQAGLLKDECYECGITKWRDKELSLHLDHINGDTHDNTLDNLRLLCPNCHSQTDTYGGRNKGRKGIDKKEKL